MARFLRTNIKEIIRDRAGDYLCSGKPFNIKVLTHFINSFEFGNINILEAMRKLFMELPLSGEAQVIDRVVQIFGEKFHRENPEELKNPDHCYYLSFALMQLNTDLHREEVKKKMTLNEFISSLNEQTGNEKIDSNYLEMLYNKIQTDPLVVPGQKLSGMNKNKKELLKKERDKIMKITYDKLTNLTKNISNNI
jgi:Sec7-like guanine-nucleotide exchange factor